jgi:aryl-alcohol dehydrogenase-like predicted oxidoreductase
LKTVRFGKTGLKVSKLCLGTMTLGSRDWKPWALDEAESKPILKQALDCGFTFFDMADWYSTGENERVVASTLTSMVPRDQLVLTTKAMYPMSDDPNDRGHLHALLGQVTLKPKDGVLWAHPALKTKGLTEVSPLPLIVVAGA